MTVSSSAPPRLDAGRLLLLSPSTGLGGGVERVMDAVEANWEGRVERVDLLGIVPSTAQKAGGAVSRAAIAGFTYRVFERARATRPQVVVCGHLGLLPVALAVSSVFRRKLVLLAYGIDVWGPMSPTQRRMIQHCSHLLTISAFTAEVLATRARVDPRDITILSLPMADSIVASARTAAIDHADRPPIVLTVSRLARTDRFKGHFDIAACFGRVLERRPDARWVVVGGGDDLPALRAECQRLNIQDAVTFTGMISDAELVAHYRTAAVFALPSFADADADPPVGEGFGLVYIEAGAFGLPIIAAVPGGGSADFVVHGETGLTVSPHAPDELAAAIVRLLEDERLRATLGAEARARAFASHLPAHFRDAMHLALC